MIYNDTTNLSGVIQTIESLTDLGDGYISSSTTNLKKFTSIVNQANKRIWFDIYRANGNWAYDDSNYTDLPQATTGLTTGIAKYSLPESALTVKRIEFKDTNGNWTIINPIAIEELPMAVEEFQKDNALPRYYRLINNTIELFPAPNFTQSSSLKVYFDRGSVDFVYTDTTKTPGFNSELHEMLPLLASIMWLKRKNPTNQSLALLMADYEAMRLNLRAIYGNRFKNMKPVIGRKKENFR